MIAHLLAFAVLAAPPSAAGRRTCGGQEVETNPNWGKSFAVASRFGPGYGRSVLAKPPAASAKMPDLRARFLNAKFSVNPWSAALPLPSKDLWLAAPTPLR